MKNATAVRDELLTAGVPSRNLWLSPGGDLLWTGRQLHSGAPAFAKGRSLAASRGSCCLLLNTVDADTGEQLGQILLAAAVRMLSEMKTKLLNPGDPE